MAATRTQQKWELGVRRLSDDTIARIKHFIDIQKLRKLHAERNESFTYMITCTTTTFRSPNWEQAAATVQSLFVVGSIKED